MFRRNVRTTVITIGIDTDREKPLWNSFDETSGLRARTS
jgi:hypothetical protein